MSGITRAGLPRIVATGALLGFALMAPLSLLFANADERTRSSVIALGAIEFGLLWGIVAALRLPADAIPWQRALPRELANGLAVAASIWLSGVLAGLVLLLWLPLPDAGLDPWMPFRSMVAHGGFAGFVTFTVFLACRMMVRAWSHWGRLRQTRLRWALTHAVLVVSLVVAIIAGALLTLADVGRHGSMTAPPEFRTAGLGPAREALALLIVRYLPSAVALFVISLLAGIIVVPPIAAISFPVVGRATARLEDLANATAALRAGDLEARSPISGQDEIAKLQADFNAMAADMQRAQEHLRAERNAVAALLENRRELVASVSHELRTPLATLRGYLDSALAQWQDEPPASLRQDLETMRDESERLQRLIDDLFTLSRAEIDRLPLSMEPTDVRPVLQGIAAAAAPLAWDRGRVEVLAQSDPNLPPALVDPVRLEQAIRNLMMNAIRHTPPGGLVLLTATRDDVHLLVQVRDTGEGISATDLPHIWDRFYRAGRTGEREAEDAGREGAGLGLALVKELTEAMGGSVAVTSAPGEGSCFSLRLPLVDPRLEERCAP